MKKTVVARRPMGYKGQEIDRGQVFELADARNDEKLLRFGYVGEVDKKEATYDCSDCGARFVGESERRAHGDKRHRGPLTPQEEDAIADREERIVLETAPLPIGTPAV